jgi:hypothetical protein
MRIKQGQGERSRWRTLISPTSEFPRLARHAWREGFPRTIRASYWGRDRLMALDARFEWLISDKFDSTEQHASVRARSSQKHCSLTGLAADAASILLPRTPRAPVDRRFTREVGSFGPRMARSRSGEAQTGGKLLWTERGDLLIIESGEIRRRLASWHGCHPS